MRTSTTNGTRVVLVMNRKGGAGKSTLCRALASAAAARGETVTLFDTDISKSCLSWMQAGIARGNWSSHVEVIHSLDAEHVLQTIDEIFSQPDQEHLILIDTFGGGSEAQDQLAIASHHIVCPMMLSRADLAETRETAGWYVNLRTRVERPELLAPFAVMMSRVPLRISETEKAIAEELFASLPTLENSLGNRNAYGRMDQSGLLGPIASSLQNRGVAAHIQSALREADAVLAEIDAEIARREGQ